MSRFGPHRQGPSALSSAPDDATMPCMRTEAPPGRAALRSWVVVDGNEAAARVAHRLSEVIAIYPITPSSPMGELADAWSAAGRPNLWGAVPEVIEMQSEGGAAGALHGALQGGALATTFTASQGLLLMLPNMYKIAGELTPFVMHVAARTIATHALSIFGDHSDVYAARTTGFALLASSSVQEAQDLALVAHAATLETRVPFLHFFDGFRTSHEVDKIRSLGDDDIRALIDDGLVRAHRARSMSPERPSLRGSAQNPDVFFQAREASTPYYAAVPDAVQAAMDRLAARTDRPYRLFDYVGHPQAERVMVLMGSGVGAAHEAVETMAAEGERVGVVAVRLYRPFSPEAFVAALPATVRAIAVLDRAKEPGAPGEPLYQDVQTALAQELQTGRVRFDHGTPLVVGGRYGLSSKEFDPPMAKAALDELATDEPRNPFTVGIVDDVSGSSLPVDRTFTTEPDDVVRAVFYGLGADGTVSANKNSIKIIGEHTDLHAQGYFVYDSKKAGSVTVSHLRFGPDPIRSTYLIERANFVAVHEFERLEKIDVLAVAAPGATFLLNSPYGPDEVWDRLPHEVQEQVVDKQLRLFVVDAYRVAKESGLGSRVNTVLQTCFFELTGILPREEAVAAIKEAIVRSYGKRGESVLTRNFAAVDAAVDALHEVEIPVEPTSTRHRPAAVPPEAPDFVQRVTARILAGEGDLLPVSALPVDGTFPTDTARWEKRSIAQEIPIWDPSICIDCAKCALICPHAAIRMKVFEPEALGGAPDGFLHKEWKDRAQPGRSMTIQVAPDDCTGCGICVDVCPARSKEEVKHKAIDMLPKHDHLERERANWDFFLDIADPARSAVRAETVKGSQQLRPLFEFSGACSGCGETPYLKVLTQLFGDRMVVANATGCSSIYGGNLPTTPWAVDEAGRGPAWANSLFEDNAEFGLGIRLGIDAKRELALTLVDELEDEIGGNLVRGLLAGARREHTDPERQRARVVELHARLATLSDARALHLASVADALVPTSVWIVGGDGWAYDIGFGGLDHVLASGRDVNVLVLDTEVYSNTGGQASKATPRGAVAKFAAAGKDQGKKDLGQIATAYGDVYVGQIAVGADMPHTVKVLAEAEAHPGPSLVIAYSTCIAHGIDMSTSMSHQKEAVNSGYWPLWRYDPALVDTGEHAFRLDSKAPKIPLKEFASKEARFAMLERVDPERAGMLLAKAQEDVDARWRLYEQLAGIERGPEQVTPDGGDAGSDGEEAESS
jgi:pyruvate-ferredoxin/flavodoxin oxidoreductase